jgi:hypothetical protein
MTNGQGPLAGWQVVQAHGLTLIGRKHTVRPALTPVYELRAMLGERGIGHMVLPVWLLGIREFEIPDGAIIEECSEFSASQREHLWGAVQRCEEMIAQMRAAESGIVLAGENTKLPPLVGGR